MKKILPYIYIFGLLAGMLGLGGCTEEVKPTPYTYSQLLTGTTSKSWRLTGIQLIEEGKQPFSFNIPNDCVYDDLYVFHADKDRTFEIKEGASKCDSNDPDVFFTDTWSIVNATSTINFLLPLLPSGTYTLKNLTENSFTMEYYFEEDNYSYRFIFTSQRN
ncbi:hypothetical protein Q0590_19895 [Rhodocytophaga aerolata]|uniref:DUF5004 domain-containing protein n=1 Tax=Rhodocytophaga aerolata TaxID=455078 RepID=A0ABT8R8Y6_9BACT|nr:hypothetical protein [Rhodocytophaga aerolata]MDO1448550.1 hypothetical protein [Rhodocytophaga aerolata]